MQTMSTVFWPCCLCANLAVADRGFAYIFDCDVFGLSALTSVMCVTESGPYNWVLFSAGAVFVACTCYLRETHTLALVLL